MVNITPWSACYSLKWGWVGLRTNLDVPEKKNISWLCPIRTPDLPVFLHSLSDIAGERTFRQ
jgi:hypothetical protein